jgi:hypothetical protein
MRISKHMTPVAAAAAALLGTATMPALAFETIDLGNGFKLDTRINLTYTLSRRMKDQDPLLAASNGNNDGDNNFDKGALTANRIGALLDAKLSRGASGLVFSASTFFDNAYRGTNDNDPGNGLPGAGFNPGGVNKPPPFNEFTDEARRYHGGYSRVLDAYGYTSFEIGSSTLNLRLGRMVVSWGEALFFPGISLAQGPADGTKTGVPGTEVKDQLLTEDQISLSAEITPRWTLLAHAQFGFHETLSPAPGSYLSASDGVGPGGICLQPWTSVAPITAVGFPGYTGCAFGKRGDDIRPDKVGQWGLGTRYRVTDETEAGLYYLNYNDRTPLPEINAFTPGPFAASPVAALRPLGSGSYQIRYFDDIKLLGATVSTTFGQVTVAGEYSYKDGAPVLVNTLVNPAAPDNPASYIPNPTRAKIQQLNVNAFANLGRTLIAEQTILIGEIATVRIGSIEARKAPGVESLPAAAQGAFPASSTPSFGTTSGTAISLTASLGYPGIFEGWDLTVPMSYSQQVSGRTILGGAGGEGDKRYSLGATMLWRSNLSLNLTYLGFLGDPEPNGTSEKFRPLTDRDQLSLVVKYSF